MKQFVFAALCIFSTSAFAVPRENSSQSLSLEIKGKHEMVSQLREDILKSRSLVHADALCIGDAEGAACGGGLCHGDASGGAEVSGPFCIGDE